MKKSIIIRALLVLTAISLPSTAAIYSVDDGPGSRSPDIFAFKPLDIIFPGFVERDLWHRSEGRAGFAGFLDDVRHAVRSPGGAPRADRNRDKAFAKNDAENQSADDSYESSFPINVGRDSVPPNTTEIYLGFSVRQVLNRISSADTNIVEVPAYNDRQNSRRTNGLSSASGGGGSLSSGSNWFTGGFLNSASLASHSGFGSNTRNSSYSGNAAYYAPPATDTEMSKGLIALRKWVWGLFFNPFAYFSVLVIAVFAFMSRFRNTPA